jgi:hypothetical protein
MLASSARTARRRRLDARQPGSPGTLSSSRFSLARFATRHAVLVSKLANQIRPARRPRRDALKLSSLGTPASA